MARRVMATLQKIHTNCRKATPVPYCRDDDHMRVAVPDEKVSWSMSWPQYDPDDFTMPHVLKGPVWADPNIRVEDCKLAFNQVDGKTNRKSHMGTYALDDEGSPLNPIGRTGLRGRGTLGKWGPNHAADPIVTRWKRNDADGEVVKNTETNKPILQFVAIVRRDSGVWAIPGGMVDAGENINVTLKREFSEEAMNTLELPPEQVERVAKQVDQLFSHGVEIYRGYVDDPRNTDNAWMETVAYNFHDEDGTSVGSFKLNAGDDAIGVKWVDINKELRLYASHLDFVQKTAELHLAHW